MKSSLAAVVFYTIGSVALAQDANPLDPRQILQELQDIQTKQESNSTTTQKRNIDLVLRASSSKDAAIALYEDAQMATQFQGTNRENGQFRDWKKRQEEQLKNDDFRESIRLHLFYLSLTLKNAAGAKPAELVPQVSDYLKVLDNSDGALSARGSFLKISVNEGIFSRWLGLGPELDKVKDWEMNPGQSDEIASKYLLPEWRKQKNPALLSYWDNRIARRNPSDGTPTLDFQEKNYALIRKPDLLWQKSQEFFLLDQPNRGIQEMFGIIKAYPNHPKIPEWIESLKKTLNPGKPAPLEVTPINDNPPFANP